MDRGLDPRGARLQRLGPADLAAIDRDRGVVRHVLRLERPDAEAAIGEQPAEAGADQRLADIGAGAHEHDRLAGEHARLHHAMTWA